MKKTNEEIGKRSADDFIEFWESIIAKNPEYNNTNLMMICGALFASGFSKGYDFAMEDENILDKFGLN